MDGLAEILDDLEVQYTYHIHEGSEGTTANGCYTKAVYHTHTSSCYSSHQAAWYHTGEHVATGTEKQWACIYKCSICGDTYPENNAEGDHSNKAPSRTHTKQTCTKSNSYIDTYTLGCGKTTDTIESATIIY